MFEPSSTAEKPASVLIPGGTGLLGTSRSFIRADGEGPLRRGLLDAYRMSEGAISNAQFATFVADTGYRTEAEHVGWSFVFAGQLSDAAADSPVVPGSPWWRRVDGANWHSLTGAGCSLVAQLPDHPVVHVSWNDAAAYCSWIGGRLPTELEWEHAARGGLGDVRFPWGDVEPSDSENTLCNIWQGRFPTLNTAADGYRSTAPIASFAPNAYGLYNMVGNVWDWTAEPFRTPAARRRQQQSQGDHPAPLKLAKGGSFLCHKSYCFRYRIAARIGNSADSATTHMGFRVVWDI